MKTESFLVATAPTATSFMPMVPMQQQHLNLKLPTHPYSNNFPSNDILTTSTGTAGEGIEFKKNFAKHEK